MRFPSIAAVRKALKAEHRALRRMFPEESQLQQEDTNWDFAAGTDVRLQVWDDGSWAIHVGDACYDQDHRGSWGAWELPWRRCNLTSIARTLIDQAKDQYADVRAQASAQAEH